MADEVKPIVKKKLPAVFEPQPSHLEQQQFAAPENGAQFVPQSITSPENRRALYLAKRRLDELFSSAEKVRAWGSVAVSVEFSDGKVDGYLHVQSKLKDKVGAVRP